MSVRYRLGPTSRTLVASNQWSNAQGDPDATILPIEPGPIGDTHFGAFNVSDPRRYQIGSVDLIQNLLLTTLAVAVAATAVVRSPTYQLQKTQPAVSVVQVPNLLTSTLAGAVVAPPFVPGQHVVLQRSLWQPADTSRGTPKTLTADAQLPFQNVQLTSPDRSRPVVDTSLGTSPVLQVVAPAPFIPVLQPGLQQRPWILSDTSRGAINPDAQLPFQNVQLTAPDRLRPVVDTSRSQPITLQVIVPPPPVVNAPFFAPVKVWWQPPDTSKGTPKTLTADAQPPVFNAPHFAPVRQSWQPQDSSQSMPVVLIPVVTPSTAVTRGPTFANLQRFPHLLSDTSSGSSIALQIVVVAPPVVNAPYFGPVRPFWQPASTAAGTPKTLTADAQLPFQNVQLTAPDRVRPVTDTSRGTQVELFPDLLPPGRAVFLAVPDQQRTVVDTSESAAKVLFADAQLPFQNSPFTAPDRLRPVVDTSHGQPITLQVIVPPAPFVNAPFFAPTKVFWQPADTSRGTSKVLVADNQLPFRNHFLQPQSPHRIWMVVNTSQSTQLEFFPAAPVGVEYSYTFIGV